MALSNFRFHPDMGYAFNDADLCFGKGGLAKLRLDRKGILREWFFEAWIGPGMHHISNEKKTDATIYRVRDGIVYKCYSKPHPTKGKGFITYHEKEIGRVESEPGTFWKPVYIHDYT